MNFNTDSIIEALNLCTWDWNGFTQYPHQSMPLQKIENLLSQEFSMVGSVEKQWVMMTLSRCSDKMQKRSGLKNKTDD